MDSLEGRYQDPKMWQAGLLAQLSARFNGLEDRLREAGAVSDQIEAYGKRIQKVEDMIEDCTWGEQIGVTEQDVKDLRSNIDKVETGLAEGPRCTETTLKELEKISEANKADIASLSGRQDAVKIRLAELSRLAGSTRDSNVTMIRELNHQFASLKKDLQLEIKRSMMSQSLTRSIAERIESHGRADTNTLRERIDTLENDLGLEIRHSQDQVANYFDNDLLQLEQRLCGLEEQINAMKKLAAADLERLPAHKASPGLEHNSKPVALNVSEMTNNDAGVELISQRIASEFKQQIDQLKSRIASLEMQRHADMPSSARNDIESREASDASDASDADTDSEYGSGSGVVHGRSRRLPKAVRAGGLPWDL